MGQVLYRLFHYNFVSPQQHHTHISYIYNRSYIVLASDSTVNKIFLSLYFSFSQFLWSAYWLWKTGRVQRRETHIESKKSVLQNTSDFYREMIDYTRDLWLSHNGLHSYVA